jgi:hypothetical protein
VVAGADGLTAIAGAQGTPLSGRQAVVEPIASLPVIVATGQFVSARVRFFEVFS